MAKSHSSHTDAAADRFIRALETLADHKAKAGFKPIDHAPPPMRQLLIENLAAIKKNLGRCAGGGGIPQMVELPEGAPLIAVGSLHGGPRLHEWETGLRTLATRASRTGRFLQPASRDRVQRQRRPARERFEYPGGPKDFNQRLAEHFVLTNAKSLYAGMRCVWLTYRDSEIRFSPLRNRRGGNFEGFGELWKEQKKIVVAFHAEDAVLGEAAWDALNRAV